MACVQDFQVHTGRSVAREIVDTIMANKTVVEQKAGAQPR
jgi:hypothetical protein